MDVDVLFTSKHFLKDVQSLSIIANEHNFVGGFRPNLV
jgi:hypothetical protein